VDGIDGEQYYVRYCFADPAQADAFRERFGGERITVSPPRRRARVIEDSGRTRLVWTDKGRQCGL
jgi:hypothetical protein